MAAADFAPRREAFRKLHESGCFVIPNPWDRGTACYLAHLGFAALATTSAGFAFSRGLPDAAWAVPRDMMLKHIADIVSATDLPVNADFESGYAHDPAGVAASVRLCVETGVAGLSIEDSTGDREKPLYDLPLAVERIRAARAVIDGSKSGVLLTGRAECFLVGHPDPLRESIRRLQAYAEAGADVLYAPGVREPGAVQAIVDGVRPKPVNVLTSAGVTVSDLAELGVRRVSLGSALARAAWGGFIRAAKLLAAEGTAVGLDGAAPYAELNAFFLDALKEQNREISD
ncbi:MAG TPA: isocitrate lyase/phosphoenolpyruvate mutase family protein [Bryobacteraceae bacterium]|nr:isocitrate lyase/phosphoenolpyruvate mutase family protein [Bryobacteraceae bacterium]